MQISNLEDGFSFGSLSEAEDKTGKAAFQELSVSTECLLKTMCVMDVELLGPSWCLLFQDSIHIYYSCFMYLGHAFERLLFLYLNQVFRRNNAYAGDVSSDLVNPEPDELIMREYAMKLEEVIFRQVRNCVFLVF